jgi:hypothetical protein
VGYSLYVGVNSTYEIPYATLQKSLQRILEILPLRVQISSQPLDILNAAGLAPRPRHF